MDLHDLNLRKYFSDLIFCDVIFTVITADVCDVYHFALFLIL